MIELRESLGEIGDRYDQNGFIIFDVKGRVIGAHKDDIIGKRSSEVPSWQRTHQNSISGNTTWTTPYPSVTEISDPKGILRANWPTMLVSTPIYSDSGDIIAVLALRLRPETEFSFIFEINQRGKTGDIYAFDSSGTVSDQKAGFPNT